MSVTGLVVAKHVPIATAVGLVKGAGEGAASKPSGYVRPDNSMRPFSVRRLCDRRFRISRMRCCFLLS